MNDLDRLSVLRWLLKHEPPSTDYYLEGSRFEFEAACVAACGQDDVELASIEKRFQANHPTVPSRSLEWNARYLELNLDEARLHEQYMLLRTDRWPRSLQSAVESTIQRVGLCGDAIACAVAEWIKQARNRPSIHITAGGPE